MKINSIIDGKYKIISLVGKGGTAVVYKAININLGTEWAIKEISKSNKDKFDLLVEPNLLKKLQHPSLPRIVDILESKNAFYIIEDFIEGTALDNLLSQVNKFPEEKVIKWGRELSEVLKYLHNQEPSIIYRDMKPGNIMLSKDGSIKLVDFGIAREYKKEVTSDTVIIGTRGYAAPEQYGIHQTDERSDIYSLGVTLYHLVTGKGPNDPPFEIVPIRTIDPSLSEGLEHIIIKCTYQDPEKRYQKIDELIYDFENIDKLSNKYKKEQRAKKIKLGIIAGVFLTFNSMIIMGAFSIRGESIREYKEQVDIAIKTEKTLGLEDAEEEFNKAIEMEQKRSEAYLSFAECYIQNMKFDKALELLQKDALHNYKNIEKEEKYHYLLGICLFSKSDYQGAVEEFAQVDNKEDYKEYVYYDELSKALSNPSSLKENDTLITSMDSLKKAIDQSTDSDFRARGYITLADIYRDNPLIFEDGIDKQIEMLEKAIVQANNKNNTELYERLAYSYYSKAIDNLDKDDTSIYTQAFEKSLKNYEIAIKLGNETEATYKYMADIYIKQDNFAKGQEILQNLINKHPDSYKGYVEMAFLLKQAEDKKDAGQRDYSNYMKYYNLAKERNTDENNIDMKKIEKQVEQLRSKGLVS